MSLAPVVCVLRQPITGRGEGQLTFHKHRRKDPAQELAPLGFQSQLDHVV